MIEAKTLSSVISENRQGIDRESIPGLFTDEARISAIQSMESLLSSKKFRQYFKDIGKAIDNSPWSTTPFGQYFGTVIQMKTIYGARAMPYINQAYSNEPWQNPVELGSGVGCIEPWLGARKLLSAGNNDPNLLINYDSPGGRYPSRWAAAMILNSKISPEPKDQRYSFADVYLTPSSTYAIDIFMDAFARFTREFKPTNNRVVILGPSYYVLPFSAYDKGLPVSRLCSQSDQSQTVKKFFPSPEEIATELPCDAGALVITLPNNPNAESYSGDELRKIFQLAKGRDLVVLVDQVFDQLWFNGESTPSPLKVADEENALDRLVVVDGFSKSENLAGIRLAFLGTKNKALERIINQISISRLSNPPLTIEPYLQFEALARYAQQRVNPKMPEIELGLTLELARSDLEKVVGDKWLENLGTSPLTYLFEGRQEWIREAMQYYKDNLQVVELILEKSKRGFQRSPDLAAYNTFIGLQNISGNQGMDKLLKLFLTTGVVAMGAPCFGMRNPENEFWTRITYGGISRELLIQALSRLCVFLDYWEDKDLGNSQKYPVYDTDFKLI